MTIVPDNILKQMSKKDRDILGKAGLTKEECSNIQLIKSERELQSQIASFLRLEGIAFCQPRTDKRSTMTIGWPDFSFALNGKPIAFECKSDTGKVSPDQFKCHEQMRQNGWKVYIITNLSQVKGIMKADYIDKV